ncbi:MAG: type 1 glutamine amidotransferase-like domain-containing protein [Candidatus Moranbacteria bacterium]|nr:type 1 glutamine amidotransferase-like domain-containing protein [Candidatus Moranbacteria bacterium]
MGKIIAIGGGIIGKKGRDAVTRKIDEEIVALTGKANPKLLFLPTASEDSKSACFLVRKYFGGKLGCQTDNLLLLKEKYSQEELETKILGADIIYIGQGNTLKMMTIWRKFGVDKLLKIAYEKGIVMAGVSAGAICWFACGNSDSRRFTSGSDKLIRVRGLGFVPTLLCPHYDSEVHRQEDLKRMMKKVPIIPAIALDNCAAIEIVDGKYRIIKSKPEAKAYKIFWKNGEYHKEEIILKEDYQVLEELLEI